MRDTAIRIEGIGKRYRIGARQEAYQTLREAIVDVFASPFRRLQAVARGYSASVTDDEIWALKDVSFEVMPGEVVGVVGRNGAGKTTLLKVLSRITEPTEGFAELRGRVGALLEVGTGFHPELTGRENIFLSGAILGMRGAEIRSKLDEIVSFAEVEKFVDTPVKHYSSGMYLRLAFAVAAYLEPEILFIDEVLAVGDAAFQKKCLGKMSAVAEQGRTVVFVSHNLAAVSQLCTRGVLLEDGRVQCLGPVDDVIKVYSRGVLENGTAERTLPLRDDAVAGFTRLCLRNARGEPTTRFANSEPIMFEIEFCYRERRQDDHVFLLIDRADGLLILKASDDDGHREVNACVSPGRYLARVSFPGGVLNEGVYQYRVVLGKRQGLKHDTQIGGFFEIEDTTDYSDSCFGKRNGVLLFPLEWEKLKLSDSVDTTAV